jgi:GAF domain-containing protein
MKRRSRAGKKTAKARPGKGLKPKGRSAAEALSHRGSALAGQTEVAQLTRELDEALEQQAAITDILRVISNSPSDVQPVLDTVAEHAARICEAHVVDIAIVDNKVFRIAASFGQLGRLSSGESVPLDRSSVTGRSICDLQPVHVADMENASDEFPLGREFATRFRHRTILSVPLIRQSRALGAILVRRTEVRPFEEKHIALLTTFADQAAIAIENVRLFKVEQQRTRDLTESLQQQTATADVLKVISRSTFDLQTVLNTLTESAARLCEAEMAVVNRLSGTVYSTAASFGISAEQRDWIATFKIEAGRSTITGRAAQEHKVVYIPDVQTEPEFTQQEWYEKVGSRSMLGIPLLREGTPIGVMVLMRRVVRPFSEKQIELAITFAAQAVIAIENTRLLSELRDSLQEQTATSEVLQVISSSPGDLEPVFASMLEKAVRICDATFGNIYRWDGDALQLVATHNTPPAYAEHRKHSPFRAEQNNSVAQMITSKKIVHLLDAAANETYATRRDPTVVAAVELGGIRSALIVPMLKEEELVGAFIVSRQEVRPFTEKQIALVTNFAAQAVIAIENARLLAELRKRTDELETSLGYQTATSDVLKVISRSVFHLQKILEFVAETAARLCAANQVGIFLLEDHVYRFTVGFGLTPAYREIEERLALQAGPETLVGRVALEGDTVHILDALSDPHYGPKDDIRAAKVRTILGVPLTREGKVVGVIALAREMVVSFSSEQIELVKTFADQGVIAIENARLLKELRERTDQLQVQSQELTKLNQELEQRVGDQVGEIERMGRLRRFLPPQVADLIVASGTEKQLESHRREVTALFCDLRGFTGFSESADPEDVMALLREYHAAIGEIIIKYSGTLERYAGDGVMVVFNDPVPVENPALQAVLMALEMRDAIGALTEKWRRLGHDIGFGIGIAHGFATLGTIGFEGRYDYAAIGIVSNVASRLCDEAKPRQILISPRVLMAVEDAVTVEPVGEFELKGIRRPVAAYNVVAALPPSP